ncbi:MAG TPA: hypothetical protein VGE81_10395 [Candidatus Limnocylindrales bacterium]
MSDDRLDREPDELLRAAADVEPPGSLIDGVAPIPTRRLVRSRLARRLSGLAAVVGTTIVVLAVVALIALRLPFNSAPSSTVTAGIAGPVAATEVKVLTAAELGAAIAAQRAGALAPQDVVADVAIDPSRQTTPLSRECVPPGQCLVIGTLAGFGDLDGTVTVRQEDQVPPQATDPADLQAPVALRLSGQGPIEYLGHVRFTSGGSPTWSVTETLVATASAPDGQVVGVDGWLEGATGFTCGPAPEPGPAIPAPFDCAVRDYLTAEPWTLVSGSGNSEGVGSWEMSPPSDGVAVQRGAYDEYAPNPSISNMNEESRRAIYLLRMVVDDAVNCSGCRGWLVVGRLDAAPMKSASPAGQVVRSAAELALLLGTDRASWIGKAVLVDGKVLPGTIQNCPQTGDCNIGTLKGTNETVVASAYTLSMLTGDSGFETEGVLAVAVRQDGLDYLGYMGYNTDNSFAFQPSQLASPDELNHVPLLTVVVNGWLVDSGSAIRCPLALPQPPADTPFFNCPWAWVAASDVQPVTVTASGLAVTPPVGAVQVQPNAYAEFAPDPATPADGIGHVPRAGTYLLRLVQDPRPGANPQTGWQMVARLDP